MEPAEARGANLGRPLHHERHGGGVQPPQPDPVEAHRRTGQCVAAGELGDEDEGPARSRAHGPEVDLGAEGPAGHLSGAGAAQDLQHELGGDRVRAPAGPRARGHVDTEGGLRGGGISGGVSRVDGWVGE
jgi:hypothetical protein